MDIFSTHTQAETKAVLAMAEAIKALNQQLDDVQRELRLAHARIAELERLVGSAS